MKLRRTALALLPLSALVGLGTTVPAQAQTRTTHDARHDVVSGSDAAAAPTTLQPGRAEGDVVSLRVHHGPRAVRVRLRYAQLTRDPRASVVHVMAFRTSDGLRAGLDLLVDGGGHTWQGERLWSVEGRDRARCARLRSRINYRTDTVSVVVPRSCLSNPRWVRVGAGGGSFVDGRVYADDVALRGRVADDVVFGAPVRRG